MATYELQHPNGQVITIESDREPTQQDAQYLFNKLNEQTLDAQESKDRFSKGVVGTALNVGLNAGQELLDIGRTALGIGSMAAKAIVHPVKTAKAITHAIEHTTPEEAYQIAKNVAGSIASDMGKTVGYDSSRSIEDKGLIGNLTNTDNWDIDTALKKWENKPVASIGDLFFFTKVLKAAKIPSAIGEAVSKVGTATGVSDGIKKITPEVKRLIFDKLKTSGSDMKEMTEAVKYGMGEATIKEAKTPFEKLLDHRDIIVGDKNAGIQSFSLKQLDDPDVAKKISVDISNKLMDISKNEKLAMNKALDKSKGLVFSSGEIGSLKDSINKKLVESRLAEDVSQAFNALFQDSSSAQNVSVMNKASIKKFISILDSASIDEKKIDVKEMKNILDAIDDTINWKDSKIADKGLKIIRGEIRNILGEKVPQYGAFASRINKRLDMLGLAEDKVLYSEKNGLSRDFLEKLGLDIAKSDEKMKAFQEGLDIVKNNVDLPLDSQLSSIFVKNKQLAEKAEGNMKALSGWKSWNDFIGQNENLWGQASRDISRNTNLPYVPRALVDSVYKRGVKKAVEFGKQPSDYIGNLSNVTSRVLKMSPYAASLSEKIANMNTNQ